MAPPDRPSRELHWLRAARNQCSSRDGLSGVDTDCLLSVSPPDRPSREIHWLRAARNQCNSTRSLSVVTTASSQRQHLRPPDYWGSCSQPVYGPEISVSGDKQQAVSDNTSDHPTIGAAARNQCISRDLLSVVTNSKQSGTTPQTTRLLGVSCSQPV